MDATNVQCRCPICDTQYLERVAPELLEHAERLESGQVLRRCLACTIAGIHAEGNRPKPRSTERTASSE